MTITEKQRQALVAEAGSARPPDSPAMNMASYTAWLEEQLVAARALADARQDDEDDTAPHPGDAKR